MRTVALIFYVWERLDELQKGVYSRPCKNLIILRDYYGVREMHIANLLSLKNANAIIFEIL